MKNYLDYFVEYENTQSDLLRFDIINEYEEPCILGGYVRVYERWHIQDCSMPLQNIHIYYVHCNGKVDMISTFGFSRPERDLSYLTFMLITHQIESVNTLLHKGLDLMSVDDEY